jgi:hypothetical protein
LEQVVLEDQILALPQELKVDHRLLRDHHHSLQSLLLVVVLE